MKEFLIICAVCCVFISKNVISAPVDDDDEVYEIKTEFIDRKFGEDGSYESKFRLTNWHEEYAKGTLKDVNGVKVIVVEGYYQWVDPELQINRISYIADENGFVITNKTRESVIPPNAQIDPKTIASLLG